MTDVMAFTVDTVIAVEAKACEPLAGWYGTGLTRARPQKPILRSKVIAQYAQALGARFKDLLPLRYQLFHRTLSAALTARKMHRQGFVRVTAVRQRVAQHAHPQATFKPRGRATRPMRQSVSACTLGG